MPRTRRRTAAAADAPRDPWTELADELATIRTRIVQLHLTAQTTAKLGPVVDDTGRGRALLSARHGDHLAHTGATLIGWEKTCRNEAARLAVRRGGNR